MCPYGGRENLVSLWTCRGACTAFICRHFAFDCQRFTDVVLVYRFITQYASLGIHFGMAQPSSHFLCVSLCFRRRTCLPICIYRCPSWWFCSACQSISLSIRRSVCHSICRAVFLSRVFSVLRCVSVRLLPCFCLHSPSVLAILFYLSICL